MQDLLAERARVRNEKAAKAEREPKVASANGTNAGKDNATKDGKSIKSNSNTGNTTDTGPDLAQLVKSVKRKAEFNNPVKNGNAAVVGEGVEGKSGGKKRKRSRAKGKGKDGSGVGAE